MATEYKDSDILSCVVNYRQESESAKFDRMQQNKLNFEAYHLKQDFSHKLKGQSREFLPKVATAVEQNAYMIQQGLLNVGEWFKVDAHAGLDVDSMKIKPSTVQRLLARQLEKDGFIKRVGDAVKLGMLGGLIIAKVSGKYVNKPKYVSGKKMEKGKIFNTLERRMEKVWQLSIELIRQEDYNVDPTGAGLYEMEDSYIDLYKVMEMSEGDDAIYDKKAVEELIADEIDSKQAFNKARETGQNVPQGTSRKQVKITEVWGSLLNNEGELVHENVMCTIANDAYVIQQPIPNPFWHKESPYVKASLLSVPHAVWPKAVCDAATNLNFAENEVFNLLLDSGIVSVHGIKQLRTDWLEDPSQVANGILQGDTLKVNSSCPPGMKVLETVYTGSQPTEAMNLLQLLSQEGASAMFTNEIRSGGADMRDVRATAVVANEQALNNMSSGLIKNLEGDEGSGLITQILAKSWKVVAQNMNDMDSKEVEAILGKQLAQELLGLGKEEIFADTVQSCKFKAFGISAVVNKMKDYTKLTTMLQTVFSNPALTENFMKKYSVTKLLAEIFKCLDIDTYKLEVDAEEGGEISDPSQAQAQPGPDMNSQMPQAGAAINQDDNAMASTQPASPQSIANMG